MSRFDYVKYDKQSEDQQAAFKKMFEHLTSQVEMFPPTQNRALAITRLEESYMWVGKMIRDTQNADPKRSPIQSLNPHPRLNESREPPSDKL